MSRKLKFRIWDKEMKYFSSQYDLYCSNGSISNDETVHPHGGRFVAQQFTGLLANNWREIYEGDILSNNWKCEVFFSEYKAAFMVQFNNHPRKNKNILLSDYLSMRKTAAMSENNEGCEIVGNIFETPELLK